jgi:hypothetical protein
MRRGVSEANDALLIRDVTGGMWDGPASAVHRTRNQACGGCVNLSARALHRARDTITTI